MVGTVMGVGGESDSENKRKQRLVYVQPMHIFV